MHPYRMWQLIKLRGKEEAIMTRIDRADDLRRGVSLKTYKFMLSTCNSHSILSV